jgi:hypothetical protein
MGIVILPLCLSVISANATRWAREETGSQLREGRHFGAGSCSSRDFAAVMAQTQTASAVWYFFHIFNQIDLAPPPSVIRFKGAP